MLLAALLRFEYLFQIEHNVDHAYPVWQALQTVDRGIFPVVGQGTSVLFANPALTGYLYLPFVSLTRSPLGAYIFLIALNTLAVLLAYRAAASLLDERQALIAAALMAVNPWIIEYSRSLWVQGLLPFFVCAIAWLLWPVLLGKRRNPSRQLFLALVMLTLFTQTYLLSFALVIPVGILLLLFRRRLPRRGLLLGAGVFLVATAIYGVGLLDQFDTVRAQWGDFTVSAPRLSAEALNHAVRLITGADYAAARGVDAPINDAALRQDLSQLAHVVLLIALLIGIVVAILDVVRAERRDPALIALVWFGLPVLMMTYVSQPVHPFYQILGVPAGYILAAKGLTAVLRPYSRIGVRLLPVLLLPFAVLMGINSARYYQETAATPGIHDLGALPLEYGLELGRLIGEHLPAGGVVYADVDEWTLNSLAGLTFPLVRDTRAPAFSFVPRSGGLYIVARPPGSDMTASPAFSRRAATLALPDGWTITMDVLDPGTPDLSAIADQMEITSEQGMTLCCYQLEESGTGEWVLTSYWRVDSITPTTARREFTPYAHLFDAAGARVLIVDGLPVPGNHWRVGDVHIHRMTFRLPQDAPQPFALKLGLYDAGNDEAALFLLPDGVVDPFVTLTESLTDSP